MANFRIKQGYTVPISGEAEQKLEECPTPPFVGIYPNEFNGIKPKLAVAQDDKVKVGTPLFFHKKNPDLVFLSPASGRVTAINYGPRRVIEEIIIATDEQQEYETFDTHLPEEIGSLGREKVIEKLMKGGVWPLIRQRPFNKIADPETTPKAFFVNCMETAPIANDPNFSMDGRDKEIEAGLAVARALCDKVNMVTSENPNQAFLNHSGVSYHTFSGKHPAGLVGTHICNIDPINKGETVWYAHARDLVLIGSLFLYGKFPNERVVAVTGAGAKNRRYFRTCIGAKISTLVKETESGEQRFISGNVLAGSNRGKDGFLAYYDDLITVIPEGKTQQFLGWMGPGLGKPSFTRALLSGFLSGKKFKMDTNINGGHRAIVMSGFYDRVVALDVHPEFLVKACLAKDVEAMENLGILECDEEDFSLCSYVCPSKTEVGGIIREGLELMEREG